MNITMITGSPDVRCGVGTYTMRLLCALSQISDEIHLTYVAPYGERPEQLAASTDYVNAAPGSEFRKYVRQNRSEILHLQFPSATLAFSGYRQDLFFCRMRYGNRMVITAHEPIVTRDWALTVFAASRILSVRGPSAIPLWKRLNSQTVISIQNPSMLPKVTLTPAQRKKIRSQLGIQRGKKLICFLGFLTSSVQLEWMLASCNPKEHELVVMGQIPPHIDEQADFYESMCHKYSWDPHRVLKGYVPDLRAAEILSASDVVFLPFHNGCQESINTSYLAARLQGTYIITTSTCRCGYEASQNTYFVPVGDIELFKRAINFVPESSKLPASNIMTWESLANLHLDVYKQIARKARGRHHA